MFFFSIVFRWFRIIFSLKSRLSETEPTVGFSLRLALQYIAIDCNHRHGCPGLRASQGDASFSFGDFVAT